MSFPRIEEPADGVAAEIRHLIQERLDVGAGSVDDDLIASGALDSLTLVQLLVDLETHFDITIPLQDLEIDDVRSIAVMARLVARRKFAYRTMAQAVRQE